jgi:predicted DNA-binding protein (MmcQ/YjbR family)
MTRPHRAADALRRYGLGLPGAHEDHPWGEVVLKAKGKVFVFLGRATEDTLKLSVKLPRSGERLLDRPYAEPTGYGLGKSGWVTMTFDTQDVLPEAELFRLVEESYRAVARKTLVRELDGRTAGAAAAPSPRAAATRRKRPKGPRRR